MATQHPDNACPAYFSGNRFISAKDEIEECYRCFSEMHFTEYMWDWEGKVVDEAVIDRLYMQYHDYFKKNSIGKDVFLTFRIPNIWVEKTHKLPRAFMNVITAENAANKFEFYSPPLFEVILPMTTSSEQLIYLQQAFKKIAAATSDIFDLKSSLEVIEIIPLFENFESIADSGKILREYIDFMKSEYDYTPPYLRVFTARSDPALNAGFLPSKIASRQAVSIYHDFENETGIPVYPIVGGGCLPFRGGINPENIDAALEEYAGYSTLTLQSSFRYDYELKDVASAIDKLTKQLPKRKNDYIALTQDEQYQLSDFNRVVAKFYKSTIEPVADLINDISDKLPGHRERVQHIGLFGYSRGEGEIKLPRAIKFTGALYSLGVPPELLGSGKALSHAKESGLLPLLLKLCPYLKEDFIHAGHYFNAENLELLAKKNPICKSVLEDVRLIEEILEIKIGPSKPHHMIHRNFTSNILHKHELGDDFSVDVLEAAVIRKSLG